MPNLYETMKSISDNIDDFAKDGYLSYKTWREMKDAGNFLVNKNGSGAGDGIDDYYHSLLHCKLGQKGHKNTSDTLGFGKEVFDFGTKVFIKGKNPEKMYEDSIKDLTNNKIGYIIGNIRKNEDCRDIFDNKRTGRMKDEGIR